MIYQYISVSPDISIYRNISINFAKIVIFNSLDIKERILKTRMIFLNKIMNKVRVETHQILQIKPTNK